MSPDRMGPADHGSVLSRLRDHLVAAYGDGPGPAPLAVRDFIGAMDGGDALLVPLTAAPLADDELARLAGALGDDIAVVRLPAVVDGVGWDGGVSGDEDGVHLAVNWAAYGPLGTDEARSLAASLLAAAQHLDEEH